MSFDQKEHLRLRMLDLEKKLTESEEERSKLEKTCNILMRAFREEEKMRYKTLNKKYEKFLQDCSVRKRRNEVILRSLCRIEDRSRALFAKTERLKLLKDRYISYLKINEVSKLELPSQRGQPLLLSNDVKFKTNVATERQTRQKASNGNVSFVDAVNENIEKYRQEQIEEAEGRRNKNTERSLFETSSETPFRTHAVKYGSGSQEILQVDNVPNDKLDTKEVTAAREKGIISHVESIEELKMAQFLQEEFSGSDDKTRERNHPMEDEKSQVALQNNLFPGSAGAYSSETEEKTYGEISLPMGLDGVDYQNETYPESYYEQPVHHHDHTNIAADVILEEDETEDGEKDILSDEIEKEQISRKSSHGSNSLLNSPERRTCKDEKKWESAVEEPNQKLESEKSKRSDAPNDKSESNKTNVKSNLMHLLESDSESFQIEHGDAVSGNEDSDFDFSFH